MRRKRSLSFFSIQHLSFVVGLEMTYVEILHPSATSSALGALYSGVLNQDDVESAWEENAHREATCVKACVLQQTTVRDTSVCSPSLTCRGLTVSRYQLMEGDLKDFKWTPLCGK